MVTFSRITVGQVLSDGASKTATEGAVLCPRLQVSSRRENGYEVRCDSFAHRAHEPFSEWFEIDGADNGEMVSANSSEKRSIQDAIQSPHFNLSIEFRQRRLNRGKDSPPYGSHIRCVFPTLLRGQKAGHIAQHRTSRLKWMADLPLDTAAGASHNHSMESADCQTLGIEEASIHIRNLR
jgi:hypothetical protein